MSDAPNASWLILINNKKDLLIEQGCDSSFPVDSDTAFRAAFEAVPEVRRDPKRPRLLANVLRSGRHIRSFVNALDQNAQPTLSPDLTKLVWAATLRVVETSGQGHVKLNTTLKLLNELNGVVPRFPYALTAFRHDDSVQQPLQELFGAYIDLYISMIATLTQDSPLREIDTDDVRARIENSASQFSLIKTTYEEALATAKQRELESQARRLEQKKLIEGQNGLQDQANDLYHVQAQFEVVRHLGRGSFGDVTEVRERTTREVYARKQIHLRSGSSAAVTLRDVENEVKVMQRLHHDHIARVSFFIKEPQAYSIMMLPVADYDLLRYMELCIEKHYPVSMLKKMWPWFGCIVHALAYAHQLDIMHRDIKPGNVLVKGSEICIADFGVAKDFSLQEMSGSAEYFVKGTPAYRAPEARPEQLTGRKVDVFSLGCVFSEMLTVLKRRELKDFQDFRRTSLPTSQAYAFRSNLPKVKEWLNQLATESDGVSELLADQIAAMVAEDPGDRPTARKCVNELRTETALFCEIHQ